MILELQHSYMYPPLQNYGVTNVT